MNESIKLGGTMVGMGLSGISSVHLFQKGLHHDRNYFLRMSGQQLIIYRGSVKRPRRQEIHENSLANLRKKGKTEGISSSVRRKIMRYIDAWFTTIDFAKTSGLEENTTIKKYLALITLTLPYTQFHDDLYLKRYALMMFIKDLKRKYPTVEYLWKAESQENGNIHFHIIVDEFIAKEKIDKMWYSRMSLLGYMQKYEEKEGKDNPPSCNVESLRDKNSAGAYVAKYFSKHEDRREIKGRCWGCSDKIKELANAEMSIKEKDLDTVFEIVNTNIANVYITDYCVIMKHVQNLENLFQYALNNYTFYNTLIKNTHILYDHQYQAFTGEMLTDWERDIVNELGPIQSSYLFNNDMLDY